MNTHIKANIILCVIITILETVSTKISSAQELVSSVDSSEIWSYHYQFTGIQQEHGSFSAKYSGENSLQNTSENPYSVTATLFLGRSLWEGTEVYFNPEMSGGSGFSLTRGIASFPNGEVYRVDDETPKVYVARAFLRQQFSLGNSDFEKIQSDQNQLGCLLPTSRLTITLGKFSITDIFDDNSYSHDPRTQFMNWAIWAAGAWDYPADTRGYDWGIAFELHQPDWALHFAAVLEPTYANGPEFDMKISKAHSLNLELVKPVNLLGQSGNIHLIGFLNQAHMGNYRQAITEAAANGSVPDICTTRAYSSKYGFVIGIEQPLSNTLGLFSRLSWNDGKTETWTYTEIDRSLQLGMNIRGEAWNRSNDAIGIALALNGLSQDHRDYLAAGGYGFIIGDGHLNYGLEQALEVFYNIEMSSTFWLTIDNQTIENPGYNKDRGPIVNAFAIRGHVEL